jgi:hypothetical protein
MRYHASMPRLTALTLALLLCAPLGALQTAAPQKKEAAMPHHAQGTFTVDIKPLSPAPADGLSRFSIDKQIHGDLEGSTKGEMYAGGDYTKGAAGYVAIEVVTGTLDGKQGSFALMQMATMDASGLKLTAKVVPGSGTGALQGIAGTFTIDPTGGKHLWTLDYTLPSS